MRRPVCVLLLAALLTPSFAEAQALPNITLARVVYNTRKTTVNPQGELKLQIDAVDKAIADASQVGNTAEVRRQMAKGLTLLAGRQWTPALDFQNSLALRSEHTVADSSAHYTLRLEQIYRPAIDLTPALSVAMRLKKRAAAPGAAPATPPPYELVRELGVFDGVSRDLRESPFGMDVDVSGVPDAAYAIEAEVLDGSTVLATTMLPVVLHQGLDARVRTLAAAAATVPASVRADVTYPADYIRTVNRGRVGLGTFDVSAELAAAEAIVAAAKGNKDPFKGRVGDFERHYLLEGANEVMPYRVYVPKRYSASRPMPLVIALHGLGGTEDSFFDSYAKVTPTLAEQHGFLMAAPLGYRVDGAYGVPRIGATDVASKRRTEYSEKDVLEVLERMKTEYNVDRSRIYLIGHSMGAIGTWALTAKHSHIWAAVAPFSGRGSPLLAERMKAIPQFVVHGDADPTVNVAGSRTMVAALKAVGASVTYIEVPGGNHNDVVVSQLPKAFEFLATQTRSRTAVTPQQ